MWTRLDLEMQSVGRFLTRAPCHIRLRCGEPWSNEFTPIPRQAVRNATQARLLGVIREIDLWRVALFMVKRYADDAEANADRRADELETEDDQAGDLASGLMPSTQHLGD
jgi:hypothetical protein